MVIGHPDHELLFVGKQVALMSGVRHSNTVTLAANNYPEHCIQIKDLRDKHQEMVSDCLRDSRGRALRGGAWLMAEPAVYKMLLRGHAPQSEPFRKWVTEEVLPSIRKTGSYDIAKSETPEGLQFAEEFGKLRAEIGMLASEVKGLREVIAELRA